MNTAGQFIRRSAGKVVRSESYAEFRMYVQNWRHLGPTRFVRWQLLLLNAWIRCRRNLHAYRLLTESDLRSARKSDKVFVFGAGYSLNELSSKEWRHIQDHDVLGFTNFFYQRWIRTDYHLLRAGVETVEGIFNWREFTLEYLNALNTNPLFRNTMLILHGDYTAQFCNLAIGYQLLRTGAGIYRFAAARALGPPTRHLKDGLRHGVGTLFDAVNFAYCLGWKDIVMVGVDLYDSRYFWLRPDETTSLDKGTGMIVPGRIHVRGGRYDQPHNTVRNGIIESMQGWGKFLADDGVRLSVYNPRSLLAAVLPVYRRDGPV